MLICIEIWLDFLKIAQVLLRGEVYNVNVGFEISNVGHPILLLKVYSTSIFLHTNMSKYSSVWNQYLYLDSYFTTLSFSALPYQITFTSSELSMDHLFCQLEMESSQMKYSSSICCTIKYWCFFHFHSHLRCFIMFWCVFYDWRYFRLRFIYGNY